MDGARPHLLPASEHFISFSRRIRRASAVNLSKKIEAVSAELAGYLCINGGTIKIENLEVLLEDISSKFSLVLEGHEVLRSEIRELGRKADGRFDLYTQSSVSLENEVKRLCPFPNSLTKDDISWRMSKTLA